MFFLVSDNVLQTDEERDLMKKHWHLNRCREQGKTGNEEYI